MVLDDFQLLEEIEMRMQRSGEAPEVAVGDARGGGIAVLRRDVGLQPGDERGHLRQRRSRQLRAVLLRPPPHLHPHYVIYD